MDPLGPGKAPEKYFYEADRFLPLLTYNHANKADLASKIQDLIKILNERPEKPGDGNQFTIYSDFIRKELYDDMVSRSVIFCEASANKLMDKVDSMAYMDCQGGLSRNYLILHYL